MAESEPGTLKRGATRHRRTSFRMYLPMCSLGGLLLMVGFFPLIALVFFALNENPSPVVEDLLNENKVCVMCREVIYDRLDQLIATYPLPPRQPADMEALSELRLRGVESAITRLTRNGKVSSPRLAQALKLFRMLCTKDTSQQSSSLHSFPNAQAWVSNCSALLEPRRAALVEVLMVREGAHTNRQQRTNVDCPVLPSYATSPASLPSWCVQRQQQFVQEGTGPYCWEVCEEKMMWLGRVYTFVFRIMVSSGAKWVFHQTRELGGSVLVLGCVGSLLVLILQLKVHRMSLSHADSEAPAARSDGFQAFGKHQLQPEVGGESFAKRKGAAGSTSLRSRHGR